MNVFVLNENPNSAAVAQCDKHVVKQPLESSQMLCTAHRVCDGHRIKAPSGSGKTMRWQYFIKDDRNDILYKAAHENHPCSIWTRESTDNYMWHYEHFVALCREYKYRYGREHASFTQLGEILKTPPKRLKRGPMTPFAIAMGAQPQCIHTGEPVKSYREYYMTKQSQFDMKWTNRQIPEWFKIAV
ncbi:MAG: hypothetical protein ACO3MF_04565 [Acholeplasmataceae bacterium]